MISALRPRLTPGLSLANLAATIGARPADGTAALDVRIRGVTLRAQDAVAGDLFAALPGASAHGAEYVGVALDAAR